MKVYAGIDLHSTNSYIGIIDESGRQVTGARSKNVLEHITATRAKENNRLSGPRDKEDRKTSSKRDGYVAGV